MKITDAYGKFQVSTPATAGTAGASSAKGVAPKTGAAPAHHHHKGAGRVEVSEQAKALEAQSAGDSAKIDRLKSAISDGSFKVDAGKIASKLVGEDDEQEA